MQETKKKSLFVVLGMPRSGTSAITRGLKALGINLGDKFVESDQANPKGFWEDKEIVTRINRSVLFALNYAWMSVSLVPLPKNNPKLDEIKKQAIKLLTARLEKHDNWGFKDPRTVKILPFWFEVFSALNVDENYVITLRNPLASAASYQRFSGSDLEEGLLLWLVHLVPAIEDTIAKKRLVVSYELMLRNPHVQLERIKRAFSLQNHLSKEELEKYADEFLDQGLQHYEYTLEAFEAHPATAVVPLSIKIYKLLLKLAHDELTFNDEQFITEWQTLLAEFKIMYPSYLYSNKLLKQNRKLAKELKTIKRSFPWKLTYPFRLIDNLLRTIRRKRREKKRNVRDCLTATQ